MQSTISFRYVTIHRERYIFYADQLKLSLYCINCSVNVIVDDFVGSMSRTQLPDTHMRRVIDTAHLVEFDVVSVSFFFKPLKGQTIHDFH